MNVNVRPSPVGQDLQSRAPSDTSVTKPRRLILGVHAGVSRRDGGRKDTQVSLDETIRIAQTADEANFDLIFRGDFIQFRKDVLNPDKPVFNLDPFVEINALAMVTKRIGLVATLSTTFNVPYILARQLQSLDHISGGRVGWNAVTSFGGEGQFGMEALPDQNERYARAAEFVELLEQLWGSWETNSVYLDDEKRVKVDKSLIKDVDFKGRYFASHGGFAVPRSRQGWPVQFQAGASSQGIEFAARYAEAIYSASPTPEHASRFYAAIHKASAETGRPAPLIFPNMILTLADTKEEAQEKYTRATQQINYKTAAKALESQLDGVSLDGLELDEPVPKSLFADVGKTNSRRVSRPLLYRELVEAGLPLRKILEIASIGNSHHIFVGSYDEAAEYLREWWSNRRSDGFMVGFHGDPEGLENFIEKVLPQLDDIRAPISENATLRERLGLSNPQ
jgi:FMN-dependent oxidoreductase (nitrilotriacetate monooxygenase family)